MLPPVLRFLLFVALVASLKASPHLGPVTDILLVDDRVISVSQAGIVEGLGTKARVVAKPSFRVTSVWNDPQDGRLLMAGGSPGVKGYFGWISLDTTARPRPQGTQEIGRDLLYDLAAGPGNRVRVLALAAADGGVWVIPGGPLPSVWHGRHRHTAAARAVGFSPDGKWLASAGLDGVVMISAVGSDPSEPPLQLLDHTAGVESLAWSPDSTRLASGSIDSKVRVHEVTGKLVRTYHGLGMEDEPVAGRVPSRVLALAWKQTTLVAGTSKGSLHRLSAADDTMTKLDRSGTDPIYSLAFSRRGSLFVGGQARLQEVRFTP